MIAMNRDEMLSDVLGNKYNALYVKMAQRMMHKLPVSDWRMFDDFMAEIRWEAVVATGNYDPAHGASFFTFLYKHLMLYAKKQVYLANRTRITMHAVGDQIADRGCLAPTSHYRCDNPEGKVAEFLSLLSVDSVRTFVRLMVVNDFRGLLLALECPAMRRFGRRFGVTRNEIESLRRDVRRHANALE